MRSALALSLLLTLSRHALCAEDWSQWRGPTGDNHAPAGATAPVSWDDQGPFAWKTAIPGRGHSSPTLVGDRIYLTTGDAGAGTQSLLILSRSTGEVLRNETIHTGGLPTRIHPNNSHASPTVASDGSRVFAMFHNRDRVWVTAFDLDGNQLWQRDAGPFAPQLYEFGFGSSPRLADGVLVFSSEFDGDGSAVHGLDPATGETLWTTPRPERLSYSTPSIVPVGGDQQLLMTGNYQVAAYEPKTGRELWQRSDITTQATCGTMVWDTGLGLAFGSGGYPDDFTLAIDLGGDHEVVWQNRTRCYEQSLLVVDGHVYGIDESGVAYCWRGADGEQQWRKRLGGRFSASPLLVDGRIYLTNEAGKTFVFAPDPSGYRSLAENQLGDSGFATFTPADGRLYHRYANTEGGVRQEYVVAIGE